MRSIVILAIGLVIGGSAVTAIAWRNPAAKIICAATGKNLTVSSQFPQESFRCDMFLPTAKLRGIYVTGFEQSSLWDPDVQGLSWVAFDDAAHADMEKLLKSKVEPNRRYLIEFEGQRAVERGGFGHLGGYDHLVLVSKVTAASPATPKP